MLSERTDHEVNGEGVEASLFPECSVGNRGPSTARLIRERMSLFAQDDTGVGLGMTRW